MGQLSIVRNNRGAHHWPNAPKTQLRRAVSNFDQGDARRSDGTAMPLRAGDLQYPPLLLPLFCFLHPIFYFCVGVIIIITQNQFLLLEARFGFRYASNRVPKTTGAIRRFSFALNCRAAAKGGCRACRICSAKASLWPVILRRLRIRSVWHLLQIVIMAISFSGER